jgi:hypothetical protein
MPRGPLGNDVVFGASDRGDDLLLRYLTHLEFASVSA